LRAENRFALFLNPLCLSKSSDPERHGVGADWRAARLMETPMQYLLMIYDDESAFAKAKPEDMGQLMAAYQAYTEALNASGVMVGANRLRDTSDATTVKVVDGKTQVLDGPYAETKEQLGGYYLIDVADLDAALGWAARCPGASTGTMEVRPVY
jgi:hypothetical protein